MKKESWIKKVTDLADLDSEPIPGKTLIELVDDKCLLVENHRGVTGYCHEMITVKGQKGYICIQGMGLKLKRMCADQLMIRGLIRSVRICGRD